MKPVIILKRGQRRLPKELAEALRNARKNVNGIGPPIYTLDGRVYVPTSEWKNTSSKGLSTFIKESGNEQ